MLRSMVRARKLGAGQRVADDGLGYSTDGAIGTGVGRPAKVVPTVLHVNTECAQRSAARTAS